MLRITPQQNQQTEITLVLEGRLVGPWVGVLRQSCDVWAQQLRALDLAEVSFADPAGLQLLRQLQAAAVVLRNCSPFVSAQLQQSAQPQR